MTKEELDFIGSMNMCDEISNEAYEKIVCHAEETIVSEDCVSRKAVKEGMIKYGFHAPDMTVTEFIEDELPPVTPTQRWIPVSERLPNSDIECLVTDEDGECGVGYYCENANAWDSPNWGWLERKDRVDNKEAFTEPCGIGKVIAWMPLPQPYEDKRGNENVSS